MAAGELYIDGNRVWTGEATSFEVTQTGLSEEGGSVVYTYPDEGFKGFSSRSDRTTLDYPIGSTELYVETAGDRKYLYTVAQPLPKKFISLKNLAQFKGYLELAFQQASEALGGKADKTTVITETAGQASYEIAPNTITKLGQLASIVTITLGTGVSGKASVYDCIFSTGATAPTITWPTGIGWAGGSAPTINASKSYEVSISEGLALIQEF